MKRIGGLRRKTRHKLTKPIRRKGKVSISRFMQRFEAGNRVHLIMESSITKGMYHPRFMGKTGVVKCSRGKCYEVSITDKGKEKILIVHPVHLKASK